MPVWFDLPEVDFANDLLVHLAEVLQGVGLVGGRLNGGVKSFLHTFSFDGKFYLKSCSLLVEN